MFGNLRRARAEKIANEEAARNAEQLKTMFEIGDVVNAVADDSGIEQQIRMSVNLIDNVKADGRAEPGTPNFDPNIDAFLAAKLGIQLSDDNREMVYRAVVDAFDTDDQADQVAAQ